MGNSTAKATITNLSEQINNVAMESVQDCQVLSTQKQTLNVSNSGIRLFGNYGMKQTTEVHSNCFSDVDRQTHLQNNIINAITQSTSATGQALWPAFGETKAKAATNVTNIIRNNVTMKNIQRTYTAIQQEQSLNVDNSGLAIYEKVDMSQGAQVFAAATLQEVAKTGIFNRIENQIDQTTSAKVESPLSSLVFIAIVIIVIIAAIVGVVIISWPSRSPDASTASVKPNNL